MIVSKLIAASFMAFLTISCLPSADADEIEKHRNCPRGEHYNGTFEIWKGRYHVRLPSCIAVTEMPGACLFLSGIGNVTQACQPGSYGARYSDSEGNVVGNSDYAEHVDIYWNQLTKDFGDCPTEVIAKDLLDYANYGWADSAVHFDKIETVMLDAAPDWPLIARDYPGICGSRGRDWKAIR